MKFEREILNLRPQTKGFEKESLNIIVAELRSDQEILFLSVMINDPNFRLMHQSHYALDVHKRRETHYNESSICTVVFQMSNKYFDRLTNRAGSFGTWFSNWQIPEGNNILDPAP